jgi:iron complex transport system substrate-binding protein
MKILLLNILKPTGPKQTFHCLNFKLHALKLKSILIILLISSMLTACKYQGAQENNSRSTASRNTSHPAYAGKFTVERTGSYNLVTVHAPWQNAPDHSFRYLTGSDPQNIPDSLSHHTFIQTPVERAVIMSTTYISFLDTLGVLQSVKGVSGGSNIYHPLLRERFAEGSVREVGHDQSMNYEVLVDLRPDVVFMFGVQSGVVQTIKKLEEIGITVVICADYLEPHPLGRSEWLKFFAAFYDKERLADSIFAGIAERYNSVAEAAVENSAEPSVFLGLPWKDAWYVAGGRSFAAQLISDAGGTYIFEDEAHAEARPVSIEKVFLHALEADIWINPGVATNRRTIIDHDRRFEMLNAFQQDRVFNHTKRVSPGGGNDYWESGVLRPDRLLEDLSAIFRDPRVKESELFYYERLK